MIINKDSYENEVGKAPSVTNTEPSLPDDDVMAKVLPEQLEAYYYGIFSGVFSYSKLPYFWPYLHVYVLIYIVVIPQSTLVLLFCSLCT